MASGGRRPEPIEEVEEDLDVEQLTMERRGNVETLNIRFKLHRGAPMQCGSVRNEENEKQYNRAGPFVGGISVNIDCRMQAFLQFMRCLVRRKVLTFRGRSSITFRSEECLTFNFALAWLRE